MKKMFVLFLAFVMLFVEIPFLGNAVTIDSDDNLYTSVESSSKYHFYFDKEEYHNIDDNDTCIEAFLYMTELQRNAVLDDPLVKITFEFDDDFTDTKEYAERTAKYCASKTKEEENTARKELNMAVKTFHEERSKENMEMLSEMKAMDVNEIKYSPFIQTKMDIDDIDIYKLIELTETGRVVSISFAFEEETETTASWDTVLEEIGAMDIVDTGTYQGEGIKIGVLESGGVCDTNHTYLKGKSITLENTSSQISDHATQVTSIIALMAPKAEFYVCEVGDDVGLEWFIEQGCSVVNCSFCYTGNIKNADGTYSVGTHTYRMDVDGVYDYQIRANLITVVVSSGNLCEDNTLKAYNPDNNIRSPGLAYNAITVGGVKRKWSWFDYYPVYDENASCNSAVPYVKPEVSAYFEVEISEFGTLRGTSFAAPQVTACVALLIDMNSAYKNSPQKIKAALIANSRITLDYSADRGNFDDRVGAGCVDLAAMFENSTRCASSSVPEGSSAGQLVTAILLSLKKGEELQVGLAWYMYVTPGSSAGYITNYNIMVYNASGELVASSTISNFSNVEMVRYTAEATGSYTVKIYQISSMNSAIPGEKISVAYRY